MAITPRLKMDEDDGEDFNLGGSSDRDGDNDSDDLDADELEDGMDHDDDDSAMQTSSASQFANVEGATRKLWLVKVPEFIYERWSSCTENGIELGTVVIHENQDSTKPAEVTLTLSDNDIGKGLPKQHRLHFQQDVFSTYAISDGDDGTAIDGKVVYKCDIEPFQNEEYRRFQSSREASQLEPKSTMVVIDPTKRQDFIKPTRAIVTQKDRERMKQQYFDNRNERLPREVVVPEVFKCFSQHKYWSLKGLVQRIKQPQAFLKEILNDLCIYNKVGDYKNLYQLKPEYVPNNPVPETSNLEDQSETFEDVEY